MTGRSHAEERGRRFAFPASPQDRDACSRSGRTEAWAGGAREGEEAAAFCHAGQA